MHMYVYALSSSISKSPMSYGYLKEISNIYAEKYNQGHEKKKVVVNILPFSDLHLCRLDFVTMEYSVIYTSWDEVAVAVTIDLT